MKRIQEDVGYGEKWEHEGLVFHVSHCALVVCNDRDAVVSYSYAKALREKQRNEEYASSNDVP